MVRWDAQTLKDAEKNWRQAAEEPAAPTGRIEIGEGEEWRRWSIWSLDAAGNKRSRVRVVDSKATAVRQAEWLVAAMGGSYRLEIHR